MSKIYLNGGAAKLAHPPYLRDRGSLGGLDDQELLVVRGQFGAWHPNGELVPETTRLRGLGDTPTPENVPKRCPCSTEITAISDEPVAWGGFMTRHYGHFLLESTARLWAVLPGAPLHGRRVVLSAQHDLDYAADWLAAAEMHTVELPTSGAVHFKRIAVPEPAFRIGAWAAAEMRDIHLHVRSNLDFIPEPQSYPLWLSRSQLPHGYGAYDELLFEWLMQSHLHIIHPESMPLAAQVKALESSHLACGVLGSAFHTLLLVESVPEYVLFCGESVHSNYVSQSALYEGDAKFLPIVAQVVMRHAGELRHVRFPEGRRLLIPEAISALCELGMVEILEDEKVAALVKPRRLWSVLGSHSPDRSILEAVASVLLDPHSLSGRMKLGSLFEDAGNESLALEQFRFVSDIRPDFAPAALRSARLLANAGQHGEAHLLAKHALDMDLTTSEAAAARQYLKTELGSNDN